jgi:L-fuculose-phosphate aldolase
MTQVKKSIDISTRRVVTMRDVQDAAAAGAASIVTCASCVITPSARDFLLQRNIEIVSNGCAKSAETGSTGPTGSVLTTVARNGSVARPDSPDPALLFTPEAEAIKKEICTVGKKLWMRQFVDGNGGNISYRIGPNEVICTPTLVSKFDLTPDDLCLVDLEGNQVAGARPRTSEIFLHLEIYKAVPEAKAAVHCHPPHATAYAITGRVPPNLVIPEFEVFVGKVAISPYETPGTEAFARTVLPYVKTHNTVLLSNHGIVCWADTVTHAEWYAEVLETYCWTLLVATQLGAPISHISEQQGSDLLAIKKGLGLPDVRFDASNLKECQLSELQASGSIALNPMPCDGGKAGPITTDIERLVQSVTDAVMKQIAVG